MESHYKVYFTEAREAAAASTDSAANSFLVDKIIVDVVYGKVSGCAAN